MTLKERKELVITGVGLTKGIYCGQIGAWKTSVSSGVLLGMERQVLCVMWGFS